MNELPFGELFKLCFKVTFAVVLSLVIISIPIGLIAWGINYAITH
jgi:hypothetical protein